MEKKEKLKRCSIYAIIYLFLFLSQITFGQKVMCSQIKNWYKTNQLDSIKLFQSEFELNTGIDSIYLKQLKFHSCAARHVFYSENNPKKAIELYRKGLKNEPKVLSEKTLKYLGQYRIRLGYAIKNGTNDILGSLNEYLIAKDIYENKLNTNSVYTAKYLYDHLGNIYTRFGDYEKAIAILQKGLDICLSKNDMPASLMLLTDLAIATKSAGDHKKTLKLLNQTKEWTTLADEDLLMVNLLLSEEEILAENFTAAHVNIDKVISVFESETIIDTQLISEAYFVKARIYLNQENIEAAKKLILKSIDFESKDKTILNRRLAKKQVTLGKILEKEKRNLEALNSFQLALQKVIPNFNYQNVLENPKKQNLYQENTLTEALEAKANLLSSIYMEAPKDSIFESAMESYQLVIESWKILRNNYEYKNSKVQVLGENKTTLAAAINLIYEKYQNTKNSSEKNELAKRAFDFIEEEKSILLYENLKNIQAIKNANIPDSLGLKNSNQLTQIQELELSLYSKEYQNRGWTDSLENTLKEQLFDLKEANKNWTRSIENKFPDYFQFKYESNDLNLDEVQAALEEEQMLIEYFIDTKYIYIITVKKETLRLYKIRKDTTFENTINNFRSGLFDYWLSPQNEKTSAHYEKQNRRYTENASLLYEQLLAPIASVPKKLIIIPDDILSYIPFEILLTKNPANPNLFKSHDYLIKDKTISYAYSTALWKLMNDQKVKNLNLLAVAPDFNGADQKHKETRVFRKVIFEKLKWNGKEANEIVKLTNGNILEGQQATKAKFLKNIDDYGCIHLATHANVNDEKSDFSFIAFNDWNESANTGKLFVHELYNMHFPMNMVVLSACETGFGELQSGDGIVSLARGFAYAGSKSMITSLWNVNDKATSDIMMKFYEALVQKNEKDEALRKAKMDYFNAQIEHQNAHPFFWAAFIPIGDMSPIEIGKQKTNSYLIAAFVFFLLAFILIYLKIVGKK